MKRKTLSSTEIRKAIAKLPQWSVNPKQTALSLTCTFTSHLDALVFIARITVHAQVLDHHPEIVFTHKKVKVSLTSHEVKGLTKKDIELAQKISTLKGDKNTH
jgi:4a-hydroxytetrahydrobiopterin dehydratase